MKSLAAALALGTVLLLAGAGEARAFLASMAGVPQGHLPSPFFHGTSLPVPPSQDAPWTPPAAVVPTNYLSATGVLFEQGLGDPRGCDYRNISVGTGEVWSGDGGVVATHGWVLPGDGQAHFAVCWNGLVYPVVSVGANADLAADVDMLVTNRFSAWPMAVPEAISISPKSLLGIKECLLLRLGQTDLATRYWQAQIHRAPHSQPMFLQWEDFQKNGWTNAVANPDPYLDLATEWAGAMFDRAVCAHERGDEALALVTVRQLAGAQPKIEAE